MTLQDSPVTMLTLSVLLSSGPVSFARTSVADPAPPGCFLAWQDAPSSLGSEKSPLKQEELDQVLAPIALYPDELLSQVLMAATYPIEVVQAERWAKSNSKLKGDALAKELEKQSWDPSVKSLVNFPQVLTMMSEKLDWTVKVGDAFISQQKLVMDTVQKLRAKAEAEGNLKTSKEQTVTTENQNGSQVIVIESSDPQVIYVPTYNPTIVYGTWWYPSYPPYYYYPPGYTGASYYFAAGVACGLAWGYAWGHCDWNDCDIDVDIDQNVNINKNINREQYKSQLQEGKGSWKHDATHRQGVPYRDQATSQKFGGAKSAEAAKARETYRGRTDVGVKDPLAGQNVKQPAASKGAARDPLTRSGGAAKTPAARGNAFDDIRGGGSAARSSSNRGNASASRARGGGGGRGGRR